MNRTGLRLTGQLFGILVWFCSLVSWSLPPAAKADDPRPDRESLLKSPEGTLSLKKVFLEPPPQSKTGGAGKDGSVTFKFRLADLIGSGSPGLSSSGAASAGTTSVRTTRELYWLKGVCLETPAGASSDSAVANGAQVELTVDPASRNELLPHGTQCTDSTMAVLDGKKRDLFFPPGFAVPAVTDEQWSITLTPGGSDKLSQTPRRQVSFYFISDIDLVYPIKALAWRKETPASAKSSGKSQANAPEQPTTPVRRIIDNFIVSRNFMRPEWPAQSSANVPFCGVTSGTVCAVPQDSTFAVPEAGKAKSAGEPATAKQPHDCDAYPLFDTASDGPLLTAPKKIELTTSAGKIHLSLDPNLAPKTATQLCRLLTRGAFDGTPIFRYEPNFVIQAANAEDKGPGGKPMSRELHDLLRRLPLEVEAQQKGLVAHKAGVLSMGRWDDDLNSSVSSFSMLIGDAPHLDSKYTIFGRVLMDAETEETFQHIKDHWPDKPKILSAREI